MIEAYIDPELETKAADVIGLYFNPQHAAVFSVDEKTAIQAFDPQGPGAAPQKKPFTCAFHMRLSHAPLQPMRRMGYKFGRFGH